MHTLLAKEHCIHVDFDALAIINEERSPISIICECNVLLKYGDAS